MLRRGAIIFEHYADGTTPVTMRAKLSSQALPLDAARIALTMRTVSELRERLADG